MSWLVKKPELRFGALCRSFSGRPDRFNGLQSFITFSRYVEVVLHMWNFVVLHSNFTARSPRKLEYERFAHDLCGLLGVRRRHDQRVVDRQDRDAATLTSLHGAQRDIGVDFHKAHTGI
jgi:hypothetical protein